jgi:2-polyprenyl-3-methyl-5-hydroxy-6-metoxy-1,4-benzoquinol methylase
MLYSPLTNNTKIRLQKEIPIDNIIEKYKEIYNIDVSSYFKNIKKIQLYRCLDSGFRFYFPFDLSGDSSFYMQLQSFDWYYIPWKWEHEQAAKYIRKGDKVLEVGSGDGGFLKKVTSTLNAMAVGLETNPDAVKKAVENGVEIFQSTVEEFSKNHEEEFDIVCSFQVAEHVSAIRSFIEAQLKCLKMKGKLIISVPNNDSFLKLDLLPLLNLPPHHMGLWNKHSLKKLGKIFGLKLLSINYEPLGKNRLDYFNYQLTFWLRKKWFIPGKISAKLLPLLIPIFPSKFKGLTIQVCYEKS